MTSDIHYWFLRSNETSPHISKVSMFVFVVYALPAVIGIIGFWVVKATKGDHFENVFTISVDSGTVLVPIFNWLVASVAMVYMIVPAIKLVTNLVSNLFVTSSTE